MCAFQDLYGLFSGAVSVKGDEAGASRPEVIKKNSCSPQLSLNFSCS